MNARLSLRSLRPLVHFALVLILALSAVAVWLPQAAPVQAQEPEPPRTVFVHLFEWEWADVAYECENFLGPMGFSAVQISPPSEHARVAEANGYPFPWWQRYQPVSYDLTSRSGDRAAFIDMVQRCDAVGVDIYVDAVINHMTGVGSGVGWNGTPFSPYDYAEYASWDFHYCGSTDEYGNVTHDIYDYHYSEDDPWHVQHCELVNLADLDTGAEYVQQHIADYLQDLVDIGVAGFRIDAAKHIPPSDIAGILNRVQGDFYVFQEVIEAEGQPIHGSDYAQNGWDVTEFEYSTQIGQVFQNHDGRVLASLWNFGEAWNNFLPSGDAVVFIDNHDNQRGHGGGGDIITYKNGTLYDLTNVFMLAYPYGYPKIMSSYAFEHKDQGPPADANGNTYNVYSDYNDPNSYDCFGDNWQCEHRWRPIAHMVEFRNVTASDFYVSNWWDNNGDQIAFGRGDKGFVVINKEDYALNQTLQTGMAAGTYCNVIDGALTADGSGCTGSTVTVSANGEATFSVDPWHAVAIHVGAKVDGGGFAHVYPQVYFRGTPNSWATTPMSLVADYTWQAGVSFGSAPSERFKFDIYGDWSLNFGDNNGDGIADQWGADIYPANGAGEYTITFNDLTQAYTVTGGGGGGGDIPTTFNVAQAYTYWGQNVYVVGNLPELGNWDPCAAVLLSADNYPTWSSTVDLPASTSVEYKYIKYQTCTDITWQSGGNNVFTTPGDGTVTRNDTW